MRFDLLTPGIEVGLVTTNLDAMVAFYEGFLELEFQGEVELGSAFGKRTETRASFSTRMSSGRTGLSTRNSQALPMLRLDLIITGVRVLVGQFS